MLGSFGLVRLRSFYDRIHAPTLGVSCGTAGIVIASMILFTVLQSRPIVHEILIGIFVTVTTPVTLMLLGRAALYRDRAARNPDVPSTNPPSGALGPSDRTAPLNEGPPTILDATTRYSSDFPRDQLERDAGDGFAYDRVSARLTDRALPPTLTAS